MGSEMCIRDRFRTHEFFTQKPQVGRGRNSNLRISRATRNSRAGTFPFSLTQTIGPPASIEPSVPQPPRCVRTRRASCRSPHTAPGDASPSPPLCPGTSPNDTEPPREPHRARAERVSTRTHDASAGGARQRRRQSETSVSRLALARFSRRDRPGPGSGARDEAPRTRSNAPTVRSSRPPPKFTR